MKRTAGSEPHQDINEEPGPACVKWPPARQMTTLLPDMGLERGVKGQVPVNVTEQASRFSRNALILLFKSIPSRLFLNSKQRGS